MFVENKIPNMGRYQTWKDTKQGKILPNMEYVSIHNFQRPPLNRKIEETL